MLTSIGEKRIIDLCFCSKQTVKDELLKAMKELFLIEDDIGVLKKQMLRAKISTLEYIIESMESNGRH